MSLFNRTRWLGGLVVTLFVTGALSGCDLPTEPLSLETSTSINAPLMADKTIQFLGGPTSRHAPLIDTTRADVDSLFPGTGVEDTIVVNDAFTHHNTLGADFSRLKPLTDSTENRIIGSTPLRIEYTNGIPLHFDVRLAVLDEGGDPILSIPTDRNALSLEAASLADDGTAAAPRAGHLVLNLGTRPVRVLAHGHDLQLRLTGRPPEAGSAARVQVDDTLRVSLSAEVTTAVRIGG